MYANCIVELPSQPPADIQLLASSSHSLLVLFDERTKHNPNSVLTRLKGKILHVY